MQSVCNQNILPQFFYVEDNEKNVESNYYFFVFTTSTQNLTLNYCWETSCSGLINMNGRMYDPVIGRMLSPDNYVADITNAQDYNRYSYARCNPLKYTDPTGNWIQYVIGAIIGGINGGIIGHQAGLRDWKLVGAIFAGAAIGAGTAGIGTGISSAMSGAGGIILGGAAAGGAGAASFNTLSGIANGVRGVDLVKGHFTAMGIGSISGAVGGIVSGGIGGGWGAFAGGSASNLTNQVLNYWWVADPKTRGKFKLDWLSLGLSGAMSAGMYHINLAYHYRSGDIRNATGWSYRQFAKNMTYTQRSMFWNLEAKTITNRGGFNLAKLGTENSVSAKGTDFIRATSDYHTHQDWGGNLVHGEGFSMCDPTNLYDYQSDEGARTILNMNGAQNIPMYLGTKEGNIWSMNGDFSINKINFNFSRIFSPYSNYWLY